MPKDGSYEFNHLPETALALHRAVGKLVRKACFDIQAHAMANAPVDTGFLKSSIYVVTYNSSTYGRSLERAVKKYDAAALLDEVPPPEDDQTGMVAVGAEYGLFVEYGTAHGPAQPYLIPALEIVRPQFEVAMHALEEAIRAEMMFGVNVSEE